MSIKIQSLIWNCAPYRAGTLLCFLALGDSANDSGECWPGMDTLAKKARISNRSAQCAVKRLCADGFLAVMVRPGRGNTNSFQINLQRLQVLFQEKAQQRNPKGAIPDRKRCKSRHDNKDESSREPSLESPPFNDADQKWDENVKAKLVFLKVKDAFTRRFPAQKWIQTVRLLRVISDGKLQVGIPPAADNNWHLKEMLAEEGYEVVYEGGVTAS